LDLLFRHSPIVPVNKILFQVPGPRKELIKQQINIRFLRQKSFSQIRKLISIFFNIRRKFLLPNVKKKNFFAAITGRRVLFYRCFFKPCSIKYCSKIKVKPFKYAKYRRYHFLQHERLDRGLFKKVWLKSFLDYYLSIYWQVLTFYGITSRKKKRLKILRRARTFRRKFRTRFFTPFLYFNRLMFYFVYKKQKRWLRYARVPWKKKRRIFRKNRFKKVFVKLWKSRKRFVFLKGLKMQKKFHGPIFISLKTRELNELLVSSPKKFNNGLFCQNLRIGILKKNLKNDFFLVSWMPIILLLLVSSLRTWLQPLINILFFLIILIKFFRTILKACLKNVEYLEKKLFQLLCRFLRRETSCDNVKNKFLKTNF